MSIETELAALNAATATLQASITGLAGGAATIISKADEVQANADIAAAAAVAAVSAGTNSTSTTSLTVGTGTKSLTVETGKLYMPGQAIVVASTAAAATNWMYGQVVSYNSGTGALVMSAGQFLGSGTYTAWSISISTSPVTPLPVRVFPVAASDEVTALTTGPAKVTFRMPHALILTGVRASLTTAQTGGSVITVDINEDGVSILSTKLTIDNTEKTSTTAATPAVLSDTTLADDAEITIDIDQVGDGTAKGLKVYLLGTLP